MTNETNKTIIQYTLTNNDEAESYLEGTTENIVIGLAHLIATIGWDSTDTHERDEADLVVSTVLSFLGEAAPAILDNLFDDPDNTAE